MNAHNDRVRLAVQTWANDYFKTDKVVIYVFDDEDEDPSRYIAVMAVQGLDSWQAAEAWEEKSEVVSVNHMGEGVPPESGIWPWSD